MEDRYKVEKFVVEVEVVSLDEVMEDKYNVEPRWRRLWWRWK